MNILYVNSLEANNKELARIGGAEWVRGKIDRAKEPNAVAQPTGKAQL